MLGGRWTRMLAACLAVLPVVSSSPPGSATQSSVPLLRIPFPQDDGSLTPYTFELGYPLVSLVYDTLLWRDADGVPQPWLARSVTPSADGRQLTVRLAEGARWHDGMPVSAEDVAFTFRYVAQRSHPRFTAELREVERTDVVDAATLVISLRRPAPGFSDQPLADMPILPAHLWASLPPDRVAPEGPAVGSGPYRLTEYRPGQGWRFEANEGYFRGAPVVKLIDVPVISDARETLDAFRGRLADMVAVSLPREAQAEVAGLGTSIARGPSYLGTVLMFNVRIPPFDRIEARRAVARLLDPVRVARAVGGAVAANRGYLHPASAWAGRTLRRPAREAAPARALGPVRVLAPDNDPVKSEAGRQVVLAMEGAGMDAELVRVSRSELVRAVGQDGSEPSFEAAIWTAPALASFDPGILGRLFGSDPRDATTNLSGYHSLAFDAAADRITTTVGRRTRQAAVDDALDILAGDVPVVPLFFADGAFVYRPAVFDGWVYVRGTGILDKRSFIEPRRANGAEASKRVLPSGNPSSFIGWAALVVLGIAGAVALRLLTGRRR